MLWMHIRKDLAYTTPGEMLLMSTYSICFHGEIRKLYAIMKIRQFNFDPLQLRFYMVKLGFTGVYLIFLILLKNKDCRYSLELPHQGSSNEYPQSMF